MPILYVQGVNVRSRDGFRAIEGYLRRSKEDPAQ